jgi:hypothetical protein
MICTCSVGLLALVGPLAWAGNHDAVKEALEAKFGLTKVSPGERLYLTRIDVKDEGLLFWFISTETSDYSEKGSTKQTRYRAVLGFDLPKTLTEASQIDEIKKIIDPIVLLETDAQAANTKTVELGQTPDQVKAALGAPDKIIKLGAKDVYVYKDMKVVFIDGKVSDVQ